MSVEKRDIQNTILRESLVDLRLVAQLTQTQLSTKLSRPQSYVSKYESGERNLTLLDVREIVQSTGNTMADFIANFEKELSLVDD
jgi:transcriptional regulator with XRE-family HTH domain